MANGENSKGDSAVVSVNKEAVVADTAPPPPKMNKKDPANTNTKSRNAMRARAGSSQSCVNPLYTPLVRGPQLPQTPLMLGGAIDTAWHA